MAPLLGRSISALPNVAGLSPSVDNRISTSIAQTGIAKLCELTPSLSEANRRPWPRWRSKLRPYNCTAIIALRQIRRAGTQRGNARSEAHTSELPYRQQIYTDGIVLIT